MDEDLSANRNKPRHSNTKEAVASFSGLHKFTKTNGPGFENKQ